MLSLISGAHLFKDTEVTYFGLGEELFPRLLKDLEAAEHFIYMEYFIIEDAALRGVDVRIIVPHVPDKKLVFEMTRSYYHRLCRSGVRIYEYEPGFIHAKSYVSDDLYAMIGTINLDYRSLVHHFENGVWMYRTPAVDALRADIEETLGRCIEVTPEKLRTGLPNRFIRAVIRAFAPLL